jgi:Tetratricopeptide repeat
MRTDLPVRRFCGATVSTLNSECLCLKKRLPLLRRLTTVGAVLCGSMLVCPGLFAQRGGGSAGGGGIGGGIGGGTGAGAGRGGSIPTSPGTPTVGRNPTTQPYPGTGDMQRPIFLSGRVLFDDGTKPNRDVVIQRVCIGNPRAEAYTDSKGHFSFQVGQNQMMMSDASMDASTNGQSDLGGGGRLRSRSNGNVFGGNGQRVVTERDLQGCELRASYPGYRSDSINLTMHKSMDNPDVGVIVLHRIANIQGTTISMTTALAPKKASKAYEKGMQLATKGKLEESEKHFAEAVAEYPKYAVAWYELGRLQLARNSLDEAKKSFLSAVEADPKYVSPYDRLAYMAVQQGNWKEAAEWSKKALSLNAVEFPTSWLYNAYASYNLKDMKTALASSEQALKMDVNHKFPQLESLVAQIYIEEGNYPVAAGHLREYLKLQPNADNAAALKEKLTKLEQAAGEVSK